MQSLPEAGVSHRSPLHDACNRCESSGNSARTVEIEPVDTRTKIVPSSEAALIAGAGATVVRGYFDPLLVQHGDRLEQLKRYGTPLLVLISTPDRPILPARARAELVAGLKVVDYVVEGGCEIQAQHSLEEEDQQRLRELITHVHARQRSGG